MSGKNYSVLKIVDERRILIETIAQKEKQYGWLPAMPFKLVHHPGRGND